MSSSLSSQTPGASNSALGTQHSALRWWMAMRPATLPAAVVPVLVGTGAALGAGHFRPLVFVAAMLGALLIQIGTNFANDLFDFRKGADTAERLGPQRVTASGLITQRGVLTAMIVTFALATLVGVYLVLVGGWPIVAVGLFSIAAGIAYTGGPWPLGYHGLGDVFVFIFFGLIAVMTTFYLHTDTVTPTAFIASLPVGLLATAILVINNLRDISTDVRAGKRTLATRIGAPATRMQYAGFVGLCYLAPIVLVLIGGARWWLFWLPLLSLPVAIPLVRQVLGGMEGRALNAMLKGTGRLHLIFGVLFAISLL